MGNLGATLTGVFTRALGADVSLRDVTITQMGNGARECEWRHAPEACAGDLGDFEKIKLSWELDSEREGSTFGARWGQTNLRATGIGRYGAQMEKPEEKECVSLSLCRRTFKLKGNKKFRIWNKKS